MLGFNVYLTADREIIQLSGIRQPRAKISRDGWGAQLWSPGAEPCSLLQESLEMRASSCRASAGAGGDLGQGAAVTKTLTSAPGQSAACTCHFLTAPRALVSLIWGPHSKSFKGVCFLEGDPPWFSLFLLRFLLSAPTSHQPDVPFLSGVSSSEPQGKC